MGGGNFLKQFVKHPILTGAVVESSRRLAETITDAAELGSALVIVEVGSGTGVFTEQIITRKPCAGKLLVLELNPIFAEATRERCPTATIIADSAANISRHLKQIGAARCDRVISGLPWASFSIEQQDMLLSNIQKTLKPGGKFVTFAYLHGLLLPAGRRFRAQLYSKFRNVRQTPIVWQNLPPAFVYCAEK